MMSACPARFAVLLLLIALLQAASAPAAVPPAGGMSDEVRESLAQVHVFPKRLGRPSEFAALAQHLFENTLINGEVVRLDAAPRMGPR